MFVTASVQRGDVAKFWEHGAAGYLAKPFSPQALREKVATSWLPAHDGNVMPAAGFRHKVDRT
jgi:CheY-like chemotaxis protein